MQKDKKKLLTKMIVSFLAVGSLYYCGVLDKDCFADVPENSQTGNESDGTVIFDPKQGDTRVYGWYSDSGDVEYGDVIISEGSDKLEYVYGGYTNDGNANSNTVTVNGNSITTAQTAWIYGGYSNTGSATGNTVSIKNDEGNEVNITDALNGGGGIMIYGAYSKEGIENNEVVINNSTITTNHLSIYGATTKNGVATGNKVTIDSYNTGGYMNTTNAIFGANVTNNTGNNISFSDNSVTISKSTIGMYNTSSNTIYGIYINDNGTNNTISGNSITIENTTIQNKGDNDNTIAGARAYSSGTVTDNTVTLMNVEINKAVIYGAYNYKNGADGVVKNNTVRIAGSSKITGNIYGGYNYDSHNNNLSVSGNTVDIQSGTIEGEIYGGYSSGEASGNTIKLRADANVKNADLYGTNDYVVQNGIASNNSLDIDGFSETTKSLTVNSLNNFDNLNFGDVNFDSNIEIISTEDSDLSKATINVNSYGENTKIYDEGDTKDIITLKNIKVEKDAAGLDNAYGDFIKETDNGVQVNRLDIDTNYEQNTTTVTATVNKYILAGSYTNKFNTYGTTKGVLTLDDNFNSNASIIAGSYSSTADKKATGGNVVINGNFTASKTNEIYAGYSENGGEVSGNTITVNSNVNAENTALLGKNTSFGSDNNLDVNGKNVVVGSVNNFDNINLNNIEWKNKGTVLTIDNGKDSDLSNTTINVNSLSLQGGKTLAVDDSMNLVYGKDLKINKNKVRIGNNFTAGVATVGEGEAIVNDDGLSYKINNFSVNPQTNLLAKSRAVAAAFINQGSDLISSGLDSLHDQYGYGFKTFAAVYGNRSTYDAGGDLKINGWSEIIGLGSSKEFADGDLDWGVFYENGSGNYRTYNQFNDEFFRGDGSMVYNGGGIAARFTKNNGWYYEGSLRVGTLKSEIDHALKDGSDNMYGYKSDTTYYGAHLGLGKIVELNDSQDLNVYGKYFHTYNDGDEFTIAGDKFSFDSVTSDRIMLGAKITTNKDNAWKTHYGLAWEYEFNGDSDMRAGQFDVPTQSLKGSTFIGEIGFSYQDKSPWSFDVSLKGYQGERDGFSSHAQATYNF